MNSFIYLLVDIVYCGIHLPRNRENYADEGQSLDHGIQWTFFPGVPVLEQLWARLKDGHHTWPTYA